MNFNELKVYVGKVLNETVVEKTFNRLENITGRIGVETTLYEMIRKMDDFSVNKVLEQIEADFDLRKDEESIEDDVRPGEGHDSEAIAGASSNSTEGDFDTELDEVEKDSDLETSGWEAPEEEKESMFNAIENHFFESFKEKIKEELIIMNADGRLIKYFDSSTLKNDSALSKFIRGRFNEINQENQMDLVSLKTAKKIIDSFQALNI